jgi:TrmH family RNA methyltransferase
LDIRVVLVEPEYGGNIGSVARSMKNFGLNELYLVNPKAKIGIEARAFAAHAQDVLANAIIIDYLDKALEGVRYVVGTTAITGKRSSNIIRTAITAEEVAKIVICQNRKTAFLFGRESKGLSNQELSKCDTVVSIPSSPKYRALNLATASTIVFYELYKTKCKPSRGYKEEASVEEKDRLIKFFEQITVKIEVRPHKFRLIQRAFRNIIYRTFSSKREVSLIVGVLRKTLNFIESRERTS